MRSRIRIRAVVISLTMNGVTYGAQVKKTDARCNVKHDTSDRNRILSVPFNE